eukprot:4656251-Pyramimonas_sp.AAC.1
MFERPSSTVATTLSWATGSSAASSKGALPAACCSRWPSTPCFGRAAFFLFRPVNSLGAFADD